LTVNFSCNFEYTGSE